MKINIGLSFKVILVFFMMLTVVSVCAQDDSEKVLSLPQEMPKYPGGTPAFTKFLQDSLIYPDMALYANVRGKVFVKFMVKKDGSIGSVQVLKGIGAGCDEEAVRVLKSMPRWKPGMSEGEPANVWFTVPINFQYIDNPKKKRKVAKRIY